MPSLRGVAIGLLGPHLIVRIEQGAPRPIDRQLDGRTPQLLVGEPQLRLTDGLLTAPPGPRATAGLNVREQVEDRHSHLPGQGLGRKAQLLLGQFGLPHTETLPLDTRVEPATLADDTSVLPARLVAVTTTAAGLDARLGELLALRQRLGLVLLLVGHRWLHSIESQVVHTDRNDETNTSSPPNTDVNGFENIAYLRQKVNLLVPLLY